MIMTHDPSNTKLSKPDYGDRNYAAAGVINADGSDGPANDKLGIRDTHLAAAYPTSQILHGRYTMTDAADLLAEIPTGREGNSDFPKYRRNFTPLAPATDELYGNVRSKDFTPEVGAGPHGGLGTAYSPTVVSPGASAGFSPNTLAVVPGVIPSKAPQDAAARASTTQPTINPAGFHNDADTAVVGTVRRFTLGEGSNSNTDRRRA